MDSFQGEIPEARSGHCIFSVEKEILLIGGSIISREGDRKTYQNGSHSTYMFNIEEREWRKLVLIGNNSSLLRSQFGSVKVSNDIFITGGLTRSDDEFEFIKMDPLIKISLSNNTITELTLNGGLLNDLKLSMCSLSQRPNTNQVPS